MEGERAMLSLCNYAVYCMCCCATVYDLVHTCIHYNYDIVYYMYSICTCMLSLV